MEVHVVNGADTGSLKLDWCDGEEEVSEVEAKLDETVAQWDDRHREGWVKAMAAYADQYSNDVRELLENKMYEVAVRDKERGGDAFLELEPSTKIKWKQDRIWSPDNKVGIMF